MNGQWLAPFTGSNTGLLFVNIDDFRTHFAGTATAYSDEGLPPAFVYLKTEDKKIPTELEVNLHFIHPKTGLIEPTEKFREEFPDNGFPDTAKVSIDMKMGCLVLKWTTDLGTEGRAELPPSRAADGSEYSPLSDVKCWSDFKKFISGLDHRRYVFRGQQNPYRLRTSFHRTGRADLSRFINEDISVLHRHLSSRTTHIFDLSIPDQNGAFLNLAQHHGYPTPLLD